MSCVLPVKIIALYTMSLLMHLFCNGHACLFLQLQFSALMSCGWLFLIMRVLTLTVFLLKILCNLLPIGKCVSTSLRKLRAMFVLTFLLNGGLNQMMLRCLFLRVVAVLHVACIPVCG